jgi:HEAT repeat protein
VKLGKNEKEVWSSTAHLLSFIRDLALKPLLEASIDSDGMVSYYATMLLSLFGEKRAVPLVQTLEKSPYANIRRNLVRALGELGDPSVVPPILKTARDWWNLDVASTASLFSKKNTTKLLRIWE